MKAAVIERRGALAIREVPEPEPGPGDVIVRVGLCGICGSDLHEYASEFARPGRVMGHEFGGTIVAVGPGVEGWAVGDRVVAGWPPPCGRCYWCQHGRRELCDRTTRVAWPDAPPTPEFYGAFAPLTRVRANRLFRVPEGVSDVEAAGVEPLAVAVHAVRASGLALGSRVLILGAGPIGLLTLQVARAAGAARIAVSELAEGRRRLAAQLGADAALDPREGDLAARVAEALAGGTDIVFDCAGVGGTVQQAVELARRGGTVLLVGVPFAPVPIRPAVWVTRSVRFKACFAYRHEEFPIAIDLIARGRVAIAPLVTRIAPLAEIAACFHALEQPNEHVKIMIDPHAA